MLPHVLVSAVSVNKMCDFTTSKDIRGATSTIHKTKYPQDIYFVIRPLYYFSKAVGLAPVSYITGIQRNINVGHHTSIKFSCLGIIHTVFLTLLVSACTAVNLIGRIIFVYPGMVATITVTDIMASLSSVICTMSSFIIAATTGQLNLGSILQKITYIDEILLINPESVYRKITLFLTTVK